VVKAAVPAGNFSGMTLRAPRLAVAFRLCTVAAVVAGVVLTAAGPATVTGLLPYFTIQSNLAYGLFAAWAAHRAWRGDVLTAATVKGAVTLYVVITGLVYHLVLTNSASPFAVAPVQRGLPEAIGSELLHTVVPLLAVLDWLLFDVRGRYRWRYALWWLAFPLGYLGFALIRGLVVHRYPYPFINVADLGYDGVAVSAVVFAVAFWILGLVFVLFDRVLSGRLRRTPAPTGGLTAAPSGGPGAALTGRHDSGAEVSG
jgi:hypothetical protein